jgi:hypothetical protein
MGDRRRPGEVWPRRQGRRRSAGLPEGGRQGWSPHVSEGGEGKAGWASRRPLGRLAGGPTRGKGEVGYGWVENTRWAKVQKDFLFKFQLFLEFGRTLENCTRRFRKKFDMGIFLKSSRLSKYFRKMKFAMP